MSPRANVLADTGLRATFQVSKTSLFGNAARLFGNTCSTRGFMPREKW